MCKTLGIEDATETGFLRYLPCDLAKDQRDEVLLVPDRAAFLFYAKA